MLFFGLLTGPDGVTKLAAIVAGHIGPQDGAEAELRPVKEFGKPAMDVIGPMPYSVLNSMLDASFPIGAGTTGNRISSIGSPTTRSTC